MIWRKEKLIPAAMLIVLFLLARSAGAAVISPSMADYTIFAGGDLTIGAASGTGSHVGGTVGAGGDVTIYDNVQISDVGDTYGGSVFANDDVSIGDYSYIMGRVMADNVNGTDDPVLNGVLIGDYSRVNGRIDAGGDSVTPARGDIQIGNWSSTGGSLYANASVTVLANADIGASGNAQNINAKTTVTIGVGSEVWGNVDLAKTKDLTNNGDIWGSTGTSPTAADSFTYTLRTAPTFTTTGTQDQDITSDAELAPGTYRDLIVRTGVTLTVSAGTYDFRNITLESGANISIKSDSGAADVIIQAFQDLLTAGNNVLGRVGQASLTVNIGNLVTIGSGSTVAAHLLAYSDTATSVVTINDNTTILGKVYSAGDVIIGDSVLVPEPDSMILLGFGTVCMMAKRRRRRKKA